MEKPRGKERDRNETGQQTEEETDTETQVVTMGKKSKLPCGGQLAVVSKAHSFLCICSLLWK